MNKIQHVCQFLEEFVPLELAESWDNVGLLLGDREQSVKRMMTCLTVTPETVDEAIERGVNLLVTHHPILFRPLQKLTADSVAGGLVWRLAQSGISVYSPHTAFDSSRKGINVALGDFLKLKDLKPMKPLVGLPDVGAGRYGDTTDVANLNEIISVLKESLNIEGVKVTQVGNCEVRRVGIACGSGGSFLSAAAFRGCDCFVTGEADFHTVLEARALRIILVLVGHYASERFAMELLAETLSRGFGDCEVWASEKETNPLFTR